MKKCYHGTDLRSAKKIFKSQNIDVTRGSKSVDFGQGFYVTDDYERAVKWAKRKAVLRNGTPAIVTIIFDEEAAQPYIKHFDDDLQWGRFVINNRNGYEYINEIEFKDNNLDSRYHITCGRIADIDTIGISKEFKKSKKMLMSIEKLLNTDYPLQYAFHTDFAVSFIKKITYKSLK